MDPIGFEFLTKKLSRDLTEKKQDLTEMSMILMVLTEIQERFYLSEILS